MSINFPDSPTNGDSHTGSGKTWVFNSTKGVWQAQGSASVDLGAVSEHILPDADITYDLGSASKKFRDLYIDAGTIHIGDETIKSGADGIEFTKMKVGSGNNTVTFEVDADGRLNKETTKSGVKQPITVDVEGINDLSDVTLEIVAETLTMAVDETDAGHGTSWKWSWASGPLAYARATVLNSAEASLPLYKGGVYTVNNFSAHSLYGSQTQTHKIFLKWIEGSGIENNVSWAVSTENITGITFEGVRGGAATEVQRNIINVPTTITLPTLTAPTVSYGVAFANAGAYTFSGPAMGDNETLGPVYRGGTYTFNLDATLSGHPFYLTTDDGTNFAAGTYASEYTTGVVGSRNEAGTLVFTVPADAPDTLYYQCGNHAAMKGTINIKDLAVETNSSGNYVLAFQHTQEGHNTPVEIRPKPTIPNNMCLVYDSATAKFVPQDMGEYLENVNVFKEKVGDVAGDKITEKINDGTVTSLSTVKQNTTFITNLSQQGELAVHTGTARWYAPFNLTIADVIPKLRVAADATVTILVKKNGTMVSTINVAANTTTIDVTGGYSTWNMVEGDYLTVDVTTIGTTNKGEDLVVQFKYKQT